MKKYIFLIVTVLILLFCVSSMTYEQQTIVPTLQDKLESQPFYNLLSKIEVTYWGQTISVETRGYYYFIEFLVRKGLHFTGYGCIAILFYLMYRKFKVKFAVIYAVLTTFAVASLDEFRQTFVSGRTGIFDDVILDTAGAITFMIIFKIFYVLFRKSKTLTFRTNSATNRECNISVLYSLFLHVYSYVIFRNNLIFNKSLDLIYFFDIMTSISYLAGRKF